MASTQLQQAAPTYESHKLREVFRHYDVLATDDDVAAIQSTAPTPETARTRRFLSELNQISMSAIVFYLAGIIPIVLVAMLFF